MLKIDNYKDYKSFRNGLDWMCRQYSAQKSVLERYRHLNNVNVTDHRKFSELNWDEIDAYCCCRFCRNTVETVEEIMAMLEKTAGTETRSLIYAHLVDHEVMENLELEYHMTRRQMGYLENKVLEGLYRNEKNRKQ